MTIHEIRTHLSPAQVLERARSFLALAGTPYAAFPDPLQGNCLVLRMEVGEMVIAAIRMDGWTRVRGSASRGGHLLTHFLTTLAPPLDARQSTHRHAGSRPAPAPLSLESRPAPRRPSRYSLLATSQPNTIMCN